METNEIINLKYEIKEREESMKEYWGELKKHDHTTYSYPFHQAKKIDELKKKLSYYVINSNN